MIAISMNHLYESPITRSPCLLYNREKINLILSKIDQTILKTILLKAAGKEAQDAVTAMIDFMTADKSFVKSMYVQFNNINASDKIILVNLKK